VLLEGNIIICV